MKIPMNVIEEAHNALRKQVTKWGVSVAKSQRVTLQEGKAIVKKRIQVGVAGGGLVTVDLYEVAHAQDDQGNRYTRYVGSDGRHYTENHTDGQIYNG